MVMKLRISSKPLRLHGKTRNLALKLEIIALFYFPKFLLYNKLSLITPRLSRGTR